MTNKTINDFEKEILRKIDNNEWLTECEVKRLIRDCYAVDSIDVRSGDWTVYKQEIIKLGCRTFRVNWERGLTECQDDLFESQIPVEVKQITKMVEIAEWVELEQKNG
ncbi:hypothetical protein A9G48_08555 [Gilliamella sp. wkB18]|uniref:hypothetical protein n=1 Tax=Gilliamella sp. wkB18 TaxID=3120260 RepID=UPI00080D9A8C|nr:hypothetical protein [Gilliamella apicola]OCG62453.1 hypothetical protein A9G48_08555 [Gilliamella apicola]